MQLRVLSFGLLCSPKVCTLSSLLRGVGALPRWLSQPHSKDRDPPGSVVSTAPREAVSRGSGVSGRKENRA